MQRINEKIRFITNRIFSLIYEYKSITLNIKGFISIIKLIGYYIQDNTL